MTVTNDKVDWARNKVAIIVPVFNAAATLAETLESALTQDMPIDVVAIDDGSTDHSLAIARKFEPKLRIISGPNRGASQARNAGIAETDSEWIVFLDADDLLEPGTLGKRLEAAQQSHADVIICDWFDIGDDGASSKAKERRSVDWAALAENAELATAVHVWAPPAAILYRREVVNKIGGFRPDLPVIQDARFLFDAACCGARFAHSNHVGARYRVSEQSLSRRNSTRFCGDILTNAIQIEAFWRNRAPLTRLQIDALGAIYNTAARGLFAAQSVDYFKAVERQRMLGAPLPLHSRIAAPLARALGLARACWILGWVGR